MYQTRQLVPQKPSMLTLCRACSRFRPMLGLLLHDASWRIRISSECSSPSSILKPVNIRHKLLLHVPSRLPETAHLHEACNTWKHARHERVRLYDVV